MQTKHACSVRKIDVISEYMHALGACLLFIGVLAAPALGLHDGFGG